MEDWVDAVADMLKVVADEEDEEDALELELFDKSLGTTQSEMVYHVHAEAAKQSPTCAQRAVWGLLCSSQHLPAQLCGSDA